MSWACACLGIVTKDPESAQGMGIVILFPLAFVSNAIVPTRDMPTILRVTTELRLPPDYQTALERHHARPGQRPYASPGGSDRAPR
jgi:hypothetical protein